jgi:hypothetical protein
MHIISILITCTLTLQTLSIIAAEQLTYKKAYTPKQVHLLTDIRSKWGPWQDLADKHVHVRRSRLMKKGIKHGLHPDDISPESFLFSIIVNCPVDDPFEETLHTVEWLLAHNANPNATSPHGVPLIATTTTYAITQCLLNHGATTPLADIKKNHTLLHHIVDHSHRKAVHASRMIALFCKAGVKPDECTSEGLSALALLAQKETHYHDDTFEPIVATTLVKVGAPVDERLKQELEQSILRARKTWRHAPHLIDTLHDIQKAVQKAQQEVETVKKEHHAELMRVLEVDIPHDPASIVASYVYTDVESRAHAYFIDTILAQADAELEHKRKAEQSACCIIQ